MPAVIVRNQGQRRVTNLGLARQFGFLQICHADYVHAPGSIHLRLCFRGKGRPFHAQISAAPVRLNISNLARLFEHVSQILTDGVGESDMSYDSLTEEG